MRLTEKLFIAVMIITGIILIGFLLAPASKTNTGMVSTPTPALFITKTIIIPGAAVPADIIVPFDETEKSPGGFGWSSAPEQERVDDTDGGDNEPPCVDVNANGICDDEEQPEVHEITLQIPPPNFKVAFLGDSGYGDNYHLVLELVRDEGADMVVHAGDLGYDEGNAEAPQLWLDQIETILDATASDAVFPYFFSMGNHDVSRWNDENGYQSILADRFEKLGIEYTGDQNLLGAKTSFVYNGLAFVLIAPGERREVAGENHAAFIQQQLENNEQLWDFCVWHKNMRAMQVGGKGDETGWEVYEACREQGAIIATAHEHSYGRTQVLSDMVNQEIIDDTSPYTIEPGQTFAFHSGLGGQSIRGQRSDIDELDYFASVYTSDQASDRNTAYGALFIEFNVDDEPRKARAYFKNIRGEIIDQFEIYNNTPEPEEGEEEIPPSGFVSAEGTELRLDGEAYRFLGFNVYGLANDETIFACGPSADNGRYPPEYLDTLFSTLSSDGVNALRFWAFQSFTNGGTDFSSFDRVIDYAKQYDVKLIPVLENHWEDCTEEDIEGEEKSSEWYAAGYRQPYGNYALSYRNYVERVITRYKDEPIILMWQLMNEAESDDADALYNFTTDVSGLIKSIDQNHLVSIGTLGTGQAGTANENFVRLHALDTIDVVEAHDYSHQDEPWPSGGSNSINRAFNVAQALDKPFFIGESGISVDSDTTMEERAELFEAKIVAAFERGVAGYLIWEWEEGCTSGNCVTEEDPVLEVMERHSQ